MRRAVGAGGKSGVRITFADTGIGIPKTMRRNIFEPFVSTKGARGTGLGLWVSCQIVEKHGGKIRVKSSTNAKRHGTVFSVFLPATLPASAAQQPTITAPLRAASL